MERGQKLKTLIVEQDSDISQLISERLSLHGLETHTETNADNIYQRIEKENYQVVLLSDQIAGSDSLDIAGKIRTELSAKPEIIVLTDNPKLSIFEVHQAGACHFLKKPLNFDDLVNVVNRFTRPFVHRDERVSVNPQVLGKIYGTALSQDPNRSAFQIELRNLGRGGFFIEIPVGTKAPPVGEIIEFELKLGMVPNTSFSGKGIVRWSRSTILESGIGVEFLEIPEDSEMLIHAFVDLFRIKSFVPSDY